MRRRRKKKEERINQKTLFHFLCVSLHDETLGA